MTKRSKAVYALPAHTTEGLERLLGKLTESANTYAEHGAATLLDNTVANIGVVASLLRYHARPNMTVATISGDDDDDASDDE